MLEVHTEREQGRFLERRAAQIGPLGAAVAGRPSGRSGANLSPTKGTTPSHDKVCHPG